MVISFNVYILSNFSGYQLLHWDHFFPQSGAKQATDN